MLVLLPMFLVNLVIIFLIAMLIRWLFPLPKDKPLQKQDFERVLKDHDMPAQIAEILLSVSGNEAIARLQNKGNIALLRRLGDSFAVRVIDETQLKSSQQKDETTRISIPDFTWPDFKLNAEQAKQIATWLPTQKGQTHA
ncbi:hypothetical protein MNBD_ALPHA06-1959 [hydrothermal vent metagenome]|uniref:Uncharacterized protein n=1 Tax=hydrothermal vent metagenome TaxID=652676 RepID=A0A3B0RI49_9ZZZZ